MARFGRFETVRELYRTGFTVVYSGRETGSLEEKFALKIYQPFSLISGEDQLETESRRFLNSAGIQEKVSASGAQHWAPVYECGSTPDGTFYATDKYDRSLQQLIDGRIKISAHVLCTIVESITKGLIELREECGRPHGNLKATNVLIVGTGEIAQTRIVLSDPLSDEQIDSEVHWDSDLRALAELIYELITHRPIPAVDGWQVPDSEKWGSLGKQADKWRNLCNQLLSARVKPGTITIETVVEELAELRKVKPVLSARRLIAAGLVIIACITALIILFRPPPPPPEKTEWESLCKQYQGWVDGLRQDLVKQGKMGQKIEARWGQDPKLGSILEKVKLASYPYKVMVNEGKLYIREIFDHPEYAEQRKTQDALNAIEEIRSFFIFDPNDPNSDKTWPLLAEIVEGTSMFEDRGWQGPAVYLGDLVKNVKPEPNKPIVETVDIILELSRNDTIKNINLSLDKIDDYRERIRSSGDSVLLKLDDVYVNNEGARAKDVNELNTKLSNVEDMCHEIAEFIESDWQTKVDQEVFRNDHGEDAAETLTSETFRERLGVIKGYYYLRPDPRKELSDMWKSVNDDLLPLAEITNPVESKECAKKRDELGPAIEEIQKIPGVVKYERDITESLQEYMPALKQLRDETARAGERPEEYTKRMKAREVLSDETSEQINRKWNVLRDNLLVKYPLSEIIDKTEQYLELRQRIDITESSLIELDEELQKREMFAQIDTELKDDRQWVRQLKQVYDDNRKEVIEDIVGRVPLHNNAPDIKEAAFQQSCAEQFEKFESWRHDLSQILKDFNDIEGGLEACYLLGDKLSPEGKTLGSIWDNWKDSERLNDPDIHNPLASLTKRLAVLVEIEQSDNTQQLVSRALDPSSQTEAAYAAWIRLSRLPESSWPAKYEDLEEDRRFRNRLEEQFEIIKRRDEARGSFLLQTLTSTSLKHEMEFIERNSSEDKVLGKLVKFAADVNCVDSLSQCQRIEELASIVADFVAGEDWPDKFLKELFFTEGEVHNSDDTVTIETFGQWLTDVNDYKKLEVDPREDSRYSWDMTISKIEKEIKDELGRKPEGDYREKLLSLKSSFDSVTQRIEGTRRLPLIEKYREDIFNCEDHWKELLEIEKKLKPVYCKRLDRLDDGQVVFAQNVGLSKSFDPLEERDGKFELLKIGGWDQLRNDGPVKTAFFYKTEGDDQENIGWPTYIRSKEKELGVILRFVPAGSGQPGPFYIATREITNAQYVTFLRENGAKPDASKTKFLDKNNEELLSSTFLDHPPCAIKWRTSTNDFVVSTANVPVTYVTYYGARTFAAWFGAELPTASQHEYACRAGTSTKYPWGNEMSGSADYAHIRAKKWQEAATKYNSKVNDPLALEVPPAPEGAVKDALPDGMLDTTKVAHEENVHASAWPIASATNPNDWGIYDMIGNVWEWCKTDESDTQPIICGGSCLSPPEYASPDSIHKFSTRANDVGFRVIVPAE